MMCGCSEDGWVMNELCKNQVGDGGGFTAPRSPDGAANGLFVAPHALLAMVICLRTSSPFFLFSSFMKNLKLKHKKLQKQK